MPSTFDGLSLFNSGPHRFARLPAGVLVVPLFALDGASPGSVPLGPLELIIECRGRLVAASEAALDAILANIHDNLTYPPRTGDLVEHSGRTWADVSFVRFTPADRTDRGRQVSLAYTARFVRFLSS